MGENQFFTGPEFRLHQRAGMTFLSNFKSLDEAKRFYPDVEDPNKYKVEDEASHMDKGRVVKYSGIAVYKIDHSD